MDQELDLGGVDFVARAVSPFREMGAYEMLWSERDATFKSLAERFALRPGSLPSDFVLRPEAHECAVFMLRARRAPDTAHIEEFDDVEF